MAEMYLVAPDPLETLTAAIFSAAGTPADLAAEVANHLVKANLSGHDSHGVIRIPAYLTQIESGRLNAGGRPGVVHETAATAIVDAHGGFGQVGAAYALEVAMRKATEAGAGVVSIRNCGHIGRLGHYAETAAAHGFIAFVIYGNAGPGAGLTAPFGGARRHLGTNPLLPKARSRLRGRSMFPCLRDASWTRMGIRRQTPRTSTRVACCCLQLATRDMASRWWRP